MTKKQPAKKPTKPKAKVGRPRFVPTDEQRKNVAVLSGLGVPQEGICQMVRDKNGKPLNRETLTKYFKDDLERGVHEANTKVAGSLFKQAMEGNVGAQCFWLKTRGRWKETPQQVAMTDPDGNPVKPVTLKDLYGILSGSLDPNGDKETEEKG